MGSRKKDDDEVRGELKYKGWVVCGALVCVYV